MNKEEYKKSLQNHYPGESDSVLELAWHFHSVEKAKRYICLLATCNCNADLANKAIREMYVSCDIDSEKAVSEKFISALLPFTCMEKSAHSHSVAYHIRKMLDDHQVREERKAEEQRLRHIRITRTDVPSKRTADVTIQIQFQTDNEEFIRQIMLLASQSNAVFVQVKERTDSDEDTMSHRPIIGYFVTDLPRVTLPRCRKSHLYRIECRMRDLPLTLVNLRSIFGEEDPEVSYRTSLYGTERKMSLSRVQRLVE